jgi:hypothetical protein
MRPLHPGLALLLLLGLGAPSMAHAKWGDWGSVLVATDMTKEGKTLTPPTPAEPVYYRGLSLGRRLGSIRGDREPSERDLNDFVADILAKQGYFPAKPGINEPTLLLILQWGYMTPSTDDLYWFLGYNENDDIAAPSDVGLIGAEVHRRSFRSTVIETILQDAQHPIYGIIITAFEYGSARTRQPVAYWQTRVGLPTHGKSMAEALPAMVLAAGPAIGRQSDKPVLVDVDSARAGSVNIGELKFLDAFNGPLPARNADEKK